MIKMNKRVIVSIFITVLIMFVIGFLMVNSHPVPSENTAQEEEMDLIYIPINGNLFPRPIYHEPNPEKQTVSFPLAVFIVSVFSVLLFIIIHFTVMSAIDYFLERKRE